MTKAKAINRKRLVAFALPIKRKKLVLWQTEKIEKLKLDDSPCTNRWGVQRGSPFGFGVPIEASRVYNNSKCKKYYGGQRSFWEFLLKCAGAVGKITVSMT